MPATTTSVLPRGSRCTGWQCLTASEQFGVIFSATVVFLVVALVYMYCLGRACVAGKEKRASEIAKHGNTHHHSQGPAPILLGPMPAVQKQLVAWPAIARHPPHNLTLPSAQSYMPGVMHHGMPLVPSTYMYQNYPGRQPEGHQQPTSTAGLTPQTQQPNYQTRDRWRQRVNQMLRVPVGKASTIRTVSRPASPETTHQQQLGSERGVNYPARSSHKRRETKKQGPYGGKKVQDHGSGTADATSILTNAATVHSDDFKMISPASSVDAQLGASCPIWSAGCKFSTENVFTLNSRR
ncbi:hypothetical protein NOR_04467 [Metarhizium rileyi]|uniref:Uncharacterized protein n=1 Tax=Metarhizium rileyi (strain RCEF 4871) TaxID=1649241 RepID=A0A167DZK0_METRR|nr:hypothetical protein NOR_04467 [Metarhizium rileyi RCEF 4871]